MRRCNPDAGNRVLVLSTKEVAHDSQADAEQAGKDWASSNGGGEVAVHRDEGEFSRIRKSDSV